MNSTLFVSLLFFSSCATYYKGSLFSYSKHTFSPIPLRSHTNEIDVFLYNEKPSMPYYKIKMVEVKAAPELSSEAMLKLLKQEAMRAGLDAIIIDDIGKQANTTTTLPAGDGVVVYQKLVGLGLKYKDRIDYMGSILKEQIVNLWPDDNPDPKVFTMNYDFNTVNTSLGDPFIRNFFFNEIYLFEDEASSYSILDAWEYKVDTFNNIFSKRRVINSETIQQADFKLKGPERVKAIIKLKDKNKISPIKYELERTYSVEKFLIKKTFRKQNSPDYLWIEEITYNSNGQPYKQIRYKTEKGKKILYFEIQNIYYSINDLPPTDN